jgi:sugar lactone lactonase YvrE
MEVACFARTEDVLGEVPLWHQSEQALYWIDAFKPAIHRFEPASGKVQSCTPPDKLGSFALRASGGFLLAGRTGLSFFDSQSGAFERIVDPEAGGTENILNDGRCDRRGRFWVGSMTKTMNRASGRLYRFENRRAETADEGIWVSNGIAFSADDKHMYFADSHVKTIFLYDFDLDAGRIGNRRVFVSMGDRPGVPDGSAMDADGCLWNAVFDGGCVIRYAPDGRIDRVVPVPVTRPTSCTFGGSDLRTLYVTTARFRLKPHELAAQPEAGSLFALDAGVAGMPDPLFAG